MDDALLLQKYHGLGNDYLVLDPNKNKIHLLERHIVKLCRWHFIWTDMAG